MEGRTRGAVRPAEERRCLFEPVPCHVLVSGAVGRITSVFSLAAGVDAIEIERVRHVLERHGRRFLARVYSELEIAYCRGRVPELAVRFAGKEAVMKALGTGVRGISWREIELLPDRRGKPLVYLNGKAAARAEELGLGRLEVSLSHSDAMALAFVVAPNFGPPIDLEEAREALTTRLRSRGLL